MTESAIPSATVRPTIVPIPGHEVYGFVPYWEMDASIVDHVGGTDLTTLGMFSVTHRRDGELDDAQSGHRRITGDIGRRLARAAHDRGARVELVYTSFGPDKNSQFYTEPEAQARWIEVLVELVDELGLDGVSVDVERLPVEHLLDYGDFVGRLRAALRARLPDAQVSVATQANELGAGMAAAAAAARLASRRRMRTALSIRGSGLRPEIARGRRWPLASGPPSRPPFSPRRAARAGTIDLP